jgi:hypothetical protein
MVNKKKADKLKVKKEVRASGKVTKSKQEKAVTSAAEYLGDSTNRKVIKAYSSKNDVKRWWLEDSDKLHASVDATVQAIENAQTHRRLLYLRFARLYGNYEAMGYPSIGRGAQSQESSNKVVLNIIQSVIDAVAAKVAKDQPKVSFVTTGADDYFLKLRATNLTKYITGQFKEAEVYENSEMVFRDAEVLGTGYLQVLEEDGKIKTEWVFADEMRVDELDGWKQKPRSMHRVKLVPRDMLLLQYPEHQEHILGAQEALAGKTGYQSTMDMIRVTESWHLPMDKSSDDGVHCLTIMNCTLKSEPYKKDYFPIVCFRWMPKPLGFFGRSITEEILTIQVEINKILKTIQQAQELAAVPVIFVENASQVSEDVLLSNTIARMIPYSGTPPQFASPTALSQEVYAHLNSFIQWAFQIVGLSQTSASGMKPAGVDSAVAIREVSDIETGRFAMVANRWEKFFVEVARVMVDMSKDLYSKNPDLSMVVTEKKILKEIKWKDVNLEDNPFDIQTFPTSQLPDTPAGRIQTITEYIQNQWISKERGMELLNLDPDLEQEVNVQTSSLRLTEKWLSEMVEDGVTHQPDPLMNLGLAQQTAQGVYTMLVHDGCPEDRLELVRQFILNCITLQEPPPASPPPPPGPEQMGPPPGPPVDQNGMPLPMPVPGSQMPPPAPGPIGPQQAPMLQTQ